MKSALILTFSLVSAVLTSRVYSAPPNILFVIADDWGLHAGAYGTPWVKTPAFDRVAQEGLLFKNAYTPMAKCAPSRAIILTGRHAWQNEEAGNHMAVFPPKFKSWPEVFMEKGWHMGITGKGWGPGIANDANGKPRLITGKPFNRRKAAPPTRQHGQQRLRGQLHRLPRCRPVGRAVVFLVWLHGAASRLRVPVGREQGRQEARGHRPRSRLLAGHGDRAPRHARLRASRSSTSTRTSCA